MHKRISRHQVRLGMFIERIEGDWLDHPFWTRRFLLTEYGDLLKLRASNARAVVIDESRGLAMPPPPPSPVAEPSAQVPATQAHAPALARSPETVWAENEIRQCRRAVGRLFAEARMGRGVSMGRCETIVEGIADALSRNAVALLAITRLKSVDAYTHLHSIAVSALMIHFGRHLGLPTDDVSLLGQAGLLHDIGKMQLPTALLAKSGRLTPLELEQVRSHPRAGYEILRQQAGVPDTVIDVCLHHHERIDGTGYPDALPADALSRAVRIASICDVYDAVTSLRPYKKPWRPEDALRRMACWRGHFDPELLAQFHACMGYEPTAPVAGDDADALFAENAYSDPVAA
jgi:putative nucleotidyltransferase with HDIG domain